LTVEELLTQLAEDPSLSVAICGVRDIRHGNVVSIVAFMAVTHLDTIALRCRSAPYRGI